MMIVDPYDMTCRHVCKVLSESGFQTYRAKDALEMSELLDGTFDLVLLDLEPDRAALEMISRFKAGRFAGIPLVVLSYAADKQFVIEALEMGASDYIIKPFHHSFLIERLRRLLDVPEEADALTEYVSFNYHELLELELKRAYRGKYPLSLLLLSFGATTPPVSGHLINLLEGLLRDIDTVIRYGSRKILIFLPMTNKEGAAFVSEKIAEALDSFNMLSEKEGYGEYLFTAVTFPEDAVDKKSLFARLEKQASEKEGSTPGVRQR